MNFYLNTSVWPDGKIVCEVSQDVPGFTDARETIMRHVLDTRELLIRDGLIQLGWTPPPANRRDPDSP